MSSLNPSMEDLPSQVMVDIISRLPIKIIIYCKCVCKKWQNLISDSYFANRHFSRSPMGLMIHHNSDHYRNGYYKPGILKWVEIEDELDHHRLHHDPLMSLDLDLVPIFQDSQVLLVGSVNSLICLWQFGPKSDNTYICNPITREYMVLPRQQYYREGYAIIVYGFGVVSLTQEYKVIRIFQGNIPPDPTSISRPSLLEAELYTLGTGQWRCLGHIPYWLDGYYGPFLNGHAHWIILDHDSPEKICVFDFDKETFRSFPSPPCESIEESQGRFQNLGVLKGCLCQSDAFDSQFTIWVMKEYGVRKSWHKEVVLKQSIVPTLNWQLWGPVYVTKGLKDGTILMVYYEDKLLAYSPQTKTFENTQLFDRHFTGMVYRPSFVKLGIFESERVYLF